ncbi:MAG: response regulator [Pseudomonadota bacterium]
MNVLVVEDDPNLRQLWGMVIEKAGHRADLVAEPAEARTRLERHPYDLMLLDLRLNGEDALPLAEVAANAHPDCRVVVVTGTSLYRRGEIFAETPSVAAVLRKPVDIEDIMAICSHVAEGGALPSLESLAAGGAELR